MTQENSQLGRYHLIEKIASGGMAEVFRGKLVGVEGFEKIVAVKKILPFWSHNRDFVNMLIDEAKVLLHLTHANIVQVNELNREGDDYYLVMEFVDGVDLRTFINRFGEEGLPIPTELASFIARNICSGLDYAHSKKDRREKALGIVHRDISPQNILLSRDGDVKITDFGIARIADKSSETATGTLKGKFAYMSPEQALGEQVDHRTDLFALGILLFEMITGERCFKGRNDLETLESVKNAAVVLPENIPEAYRTLITKALTKDKELRFQSASDMRMALFQAERTLGVHASPDDLKKIMADFFADQLAVGSSESDPFLTRIETQTELDDAPKNPATRVLPQTMVSPDWAATRVNLPEIMPSTPKRKVVYWGVIIVLALLLTGGLYGLRQWLNAPVVTTKATSVPVIVSRPEVSPSVIIVPEVKDASPPAVADDVDPVVEIKQPLPDAPEPLKPQPVSKKENVLEQDRTGTLSVSTDPWGRIIIPKVTTGSDGSFSKKVPAGTYQIQVFYPRLGESIRRSVTVPPGASIRCKATFVGGKTINCR